MSILIKRQRPSAERIENPILKYGELGIDKAGTLYVGGFNKEGNPESLRQIGEKGGVITGPLTVENQNSVFKGKASLDENGQKIDATYLTVATQEDTPKDPVLPPDPSQPEKRELTSQNVFTFTYGSPLISSSTIFLSTIVTPGNYYCREKDTLGYIQDFPEDLQPRCTFLLKIFYSNGEISSNDNNKEITQMLIPNSLKNLVYYRRLNFKKTSTSQSWEIQKVENTDAHGWVHPLMESLSKEEFAKRNHASISSEFGLGNSEKYGHLKLSDEISGVVALDKNGGVAATPFAVEKVSQNIKTISEDMVKIDLLGNESALQSAGINADTLKGHSFEEFLLAEALDSRVEQSVYQHLNQTQTSIIASWQNTYDKGRKGVDIFDFANNLNDELSSWLPKRAFQNSEINNSIKNSLQDALGFDFSKPDNPINKPQIVLEGMTNAPFDLSVGVRTVAILGNYGYTAIIQGLDKKNIPAIWASAGIWVSSDTVKNLMPWKRIDRGNSEQTKVSFYKNLAVGGSGLELPGTVKAKIDPSTLKGSIEIDFLCNSIPSQILRDDLISREKLFKGIEDYCSSGFWEWKDTKVEIIDSTGRRNRSNDFLIFTNDCAIALTNDFQTISYPQRSSIYQSGCRIKIFIEKIDFSI